MTGILLCDGTGAYAVTIEFRENSYYICLDRHVMYENLLSEAEKWENVTQLFGCEKVKINFEEGSVTTKDGKVHNFDWVFACDGANSSTRYKMAKL